MEKASRAIRRSGVKLLSMNSGHTELNVLLSDVGDIRTTAKAFMNAQNIAVQDLMRWAANEENRAVQDVIAQMAELQRVWMDIQRVFTDRLKDYRMMFEMILDGQKNLAQARANWDYCDQKEVKLKKELKKAVKRVSSIEINILESRVTQAEQEKELAQIELMKHVKENEAVKLIRLKEGFVKLSNSYIEMSHKCNTLFTAQRDVSLCLPDVHNIELESSKYTAAASTRQLVLKAKEQLANFNEANCANMASEPPPPYTPPDPSSTASSGPRERPARPANPSFTRRSSTPTNGCQESSDSGRVTSVSHRSDGVVCSMTGAALAGGCHGDVKYTNIVQIKREDEDEPMVKQALTVNVRGEEGSREITEDTENFSYAAEIPSEPDGMTILGNQHGSGELRTCGELYNSAADNSSPSLDDNEEEKEVEEVKETEERGSADTNLYPNLDKMKLDADKSESYPVPQPRQSRLTYDEEYDTAEEDGNDLRPDENKFI